MGRRPSRHRVDSGARTALAEAQRRVRFEPRVLFTCERANRALVFLRPVTTDLREALAEALRCHDRLSGPLSLALRAAVAAEQDRAVARFDRALEEIESVGVELVSCVPGEVAFPMVAGTEPSRLVWSSRDDRWSNAAPGAASPARETALEEVQ